MPEMEFHKALVVDDHRMFAESFCGLLKNMAVFSIVDQCNSIEKAEYKMRQEEYGYLFADLLIPGGPDTKEFIKKCHELNESLVIIVVSSVTDLFTIRELLGSGINAFLSKSAGSNEINSALEAIKSGEKYISVELAGKLAVANMENKTSLTKKENEVIRLVAQGFTIAESAEKMHLSPHTIIGHRRNIMQKLGIRSATEMVKYAFENKLC
jgi:DNA-binding NarL/FixJ family response regulator